MRNRPRPEEWSAFVAGLADLHSRHAFSLVVVDPLAAFLPSGSDHAAAMRSALLPLQRLAARRLSVLVLHHLGRRDPALGRAAGGLGALAGCADILIEMRSFGKPGAADRQRRLWTWSRFPDTPPHLVIERSPDGTDYRAHGTFQEEEFARRWQTLRAVCADASHKLTRSDLRARWTGPGKPDKTTLKRWLERAVRNGLLKKDGAGQRHCPFRYWLPE